ncbi:protein gone early [Anthonomus grandis grandis]|uniref:protein gone early n=1 Tax=Anthonomus grandis grandis TaxID=2921223 RepID=UPI0021668D88|nr:protein gone early [Anthonomus grandis grandis]
MPDDHHENGTMTDAPAKNGTIDSTKARKDSFDSTEADPCLDHDERKSQKKGRNLPFLEKCLSDIQEKTGLSRQWTLIVLGLVAIVVILFIVVLGLAIGWPTTPHMFKYPICRSTGCLQAAAQIQENLDSSVSPCRNFWGAVCSKYLNSSIRPSDSPVWNQKEMLVQKELERIRDMISNLELPLHINSVEWKMKHFYESCLYVDALASDAHAPLTNLISELGGWYILRDWTDVDFDRRSILTQLHVKYGISPFFKIDVAPHPYVPDTNAIRISPSGLGLPDRDYYYRDSDDPVIIAYISYIRDVVISLSSTQSEAAKFAKDMFNYEKRLAEVYPDRISLQNPVTTNSAISIFELKETTSTIPFFDILQAMFTEVTISDNTDVIVTSPEYLMQVAQIISSTDSTTLNGYLIWCLVREFIPYLSETYTSAVVSFNNQLYGTSMSKRRQEICTRLVKKYMPLAAEFHLEKTYPISQNTRAIVNNTFNVITDLILKRVNFDDTLLLTQHFQGKLKSLSLIIGLPESATKTNYLKDYYNKLRVLKRMLFENMRNAIVFENKLQEVMLLNHLPEGVYLDEILKEEPKIRFIPSKNAVVVPRSLLMEPAFDDGYPRPVIYGRLGVEMAQAILSAILPYGSLWAANNKVLSYLHMAGNDSVKLVQPSLTCLARHILKLNPNIPTSRLNGTALTVLKEVLAVKIAHEALLISQNEDHSHFSGLEQYEDSALYFLAFSQAKCSVSTLEYDTYKSLVSFKLPAMSSLELAWSQIPNFPAAFGCFDTSIKQCQTVF